MRSLITGIGGFAGGHLAAALLERGDTVGGVTLPSSAYPQLEPIRDRVRLIEGDIRDPEVLGHAFEELRPDVVFHLAAVTHVTHAWRQRRLATDVNVVGTAGVLEAAAGLDPMPVVLLASSGQVYDPRQAGAPFTEDSPVRPVNPYAASKRCAEILVEQACAGDGLRGMIVRTFNFTGPWQAPEFVCSDFARQVAWAEAGHGARKITVGNLEARRDFSDVRDIVAGYLLAVETGEPGRVYNLASGEPVPIGEILDALLSMATVSIEVTRDPQRLRKADIPSLSGDPSRAKAELGWRPQIPFRDTLASVLDFWRDRARADG